ncbi:thiol:disulfide interchange protein DsbA/DsbL [Nitrosomonas eutropha]|uniref:Thiol:disulfide interchange protein n=2 Tax=Nitrosomonas eutropha TaxID=916 RepID=A0ABX5M920_9PROT|nr:DsbA family protein [Nitrosomonas eutropha]ABI59846.1 DSBA oxidoreductase [Nitrosomonas eutropha C91]PXV83563.1 thiol:disulfide interchange protein DsbA [Nitrosomonas eutropha]SEI59780.1 thiol:disulfide interchange protein DsbA [Nitrosomonas eutropha]
MNVKKIICFLLGFVAINLAGILTVHAEIIEGKDYKVLSTPQLTETESQQIEVIEFFWYGCPHCSDLNPYLGRWLESKPADVEFRYVPAIFRNNWAPAARLFYAIESLGLGEILHDKIYHAVHHEKTDLSKEETLFNWIEQQGVERDKFIGAYNSFTVQNQANRAAQITRQYQLTGVPALVIDGKYLTSGKAGGLPQDTISVLNQLIEKVREERKTRQ